MVLRNWHWSCKFFSNDIDAVRDVDIIHTFSPCSIKALLVPPTNSKCVVDSHRPCHTIPGKTTTVSWSKNGWGTKSTSSNHTRAIDLAAITGWTSSLLSLDASRCTKGYFKNSFCVISCIEDVSYSRGETQPLGHLLVMKGKDGSRPPYNSGAPLLMTGILNHSGCKKSNLGCLPSPDDILTSCSNFSGWRKAIGFTIGSIATERKWLRTASGMKRIK